MKYNLKVTSYIPLTIVTEHDMYMIGDMYQMSLRVTFIPIIRSRITAYHVLRRCVSLFILST